VVNNWNVGVGKMMTNEISGGRNRRVKEGSNPSSNLMAGCGRKEWRNCRRIVFEPKKLVYSLPPDTICGSSPGEAF
jgi:hypothetical protein